MVYRVCEFAGPNEPVGGSHRGVFKTTYVVVKANLEDHAKRTSRSARPKKNPGRGAVIIPTRTPICAAIRFQPRLCVRSAPNFVDGSKIRGMVLLNLRQPSLSSIDSPQSRTRGKLGLYA